MKNLSCCILIAVVLSYPTIAIGINEEIQAFPDLGVLTKILGISMESTKAEVDDMIATTGEHWQCRQVDLPEKKRPHSIRYARWSRQCIYQNPSNLMQSQEFKIEAVGNTIYHISFVDRIFDAISVEEWKKQPSQLKAVFEENKEIAKFKVLKTQDRSSQMEFKEIDSGLEVSITSHCYERPFNTVVSTNFIDQGSVKTARFIAEYAGFQGLCPESFRTQK